MRQKKNNSSREVVVGEGADGFARRGARVGRREVTVGLVTAVAVAGVVAGAVLTKLLLRARADRKWDRQVERFRAQGAL
jgi:hypothetical protein